MNNFLRCIIAATMSMLYYHGAFSQTEFIYDFNSAQPLNGIEQLSGTVEVVSLTTPTDNGVANNTPLLRPKTVGSPNATGVTNLSSFPAGSDYSITWKEYVTQGNTSYKKGFLLRGSGVGAYATGMKRGYYFMVQNNGTTGSVNFRILHSSASGISDLRNSGAVTISGFGINKACWFRASVTDNVLKFEYSTDGVTFVTGASYTDPANLYSAGTTQLVYGIGSGAGQYCYDDIKFKSTTLANSTITITGSSSYLYNGTPQGPTAIVQGSTGPITYAYSGTGSSVYGPSSKPPVLAGTYQVVASVAADANYRGAVSDAFAFTINSNPEMPLAAMRRPLSPTSPMWLIHADVWAHQPQQVIDLIPEDIRPFVVINLSMSTSVLGSHRGYETAESWLNTCAQNGIWAMVQPSSGIENSFPSDTALTTYESLYKKYPNFIGYNFCEQAWGFNSSTFSSRLNLFTNLLAMSHKYGGYLYVNDSFSLSNAPFNSVSKFKTSAEFANATRVYKENMIFGNKFTSSWAYYDNESGALGAFLSGHAGNYAIRYDQYSWGWSGRGQVFGPETVGDRNADGNRSVFGCPEAVMGVPIVEHLMLSGATVIDGPEVPWMSTLFGPHRLPAFNNMVADVFRKVLDGTIRIPTVNEVAARTKVAFVNDVDVNTTDSLFSGLYAMDGSLKTNRTWFKKTGRYAPIPQLFSGDAYETSLFSGASLVKKSQYKTRWPNEQQKIDEFNSLYPSEYKGDMFVSRLENSLYSYNPWINKDVVTTASIPLKYNTCDSIALSYPAHTFSVINESGNKLQVYLNNYRTDKNQLWTEYPNDFSWYTLQNTILPQFAVNPTDGTFRTSVIKIYGSTSQPSYALSERGSHRASIANATWANGIFTLSISHNGPVDLTIDCAGSATDRGTAPNVSTPSSPLQPMAYTGEKQYEAEGAIITAPAATGTNPKRYHGTGFVKFSSTTSSSSSVKFQVINVDTAGTYALDIRYSAALGNVSKVDVLVNGAKVNTPTFPATVNDSTWAVYTQKVSLNAGQGNTVELKANASGAMINIDKIYLSKRSFPFAFVSVDAVQKNSSQIQVDWRVTEEQNLLRYEILKSTDGLNFNTLYTANANNTGDSYYVNLDNALSADTNFYKIKAIHTNGAETYSTVVRLMLKTAVLVQAESGAPGSDWETASAQNVTYMTAKTDVLNTAFPGNSSKVITCTVSFEKPGSYDLYAKIWVGPGAANDDSYYYGKGFGTKNPAADNNEWVTCNNLAGVGYTALNDVVANAGTTGAGVWKWINVSKFSGGEAPVSFSVPMGELSQTFQIGARENGLQLDKFVFGNSNQSFTVKELDSLAQANQAPVIAPSQSFTINENASPGTPVGTVSASDANAGTVVKSWQITGGTGMPSFTIDSASGSIKVAEGAILDFESSTFHSLTVRVSDGILHSSEDTITINITNENDNTPVIASQDYSISERATSQTILFQASVIDADDINQSGYSKLAWQISGGTGASVFTIDSLGAVRLSEGAALDFESLTSYIIKVKVTDGKKESLEGSLTINLSNENDNTPVIATPESFAIDGSSNNIIGTLTASDADDINQPGFSTIQNWTITGGTGMSAFAIDAATGLITLAYPETIHFNTMSYSLEVKVSDGLNLSDSKTVNITIADKVNICHNGELINISKTAALAHIKHGCRLGLCSSGPAAISIVSPILYQPVDFQPSIAVYPNPVQHQLQIDLVSETRNVRQIVIMNSIGQTVLQHAIKGESSVSLNVETLKAGIYLLKVIGDDVKTFKILKH
ncbi:glycoside hydrolase family 98 domain-containing protein [Pedobacter sp. P351]|uniref:glycoside hydrolase family 98 domain-containing protein n=1 Tax=Pedobacter superstes TaxID=3133441 RepID=UPI0030A88FF8